MGREKRAKYFLLFIIVQYLAALAAMIFLAAESDVVLVFLYNLFFYTLIFIMPIVIYIKKVYKTNPYHHMNENQSLKPVITGFVIAIFMAVIFFITHAFKANHMLFDTAGVLTLAGAILAGVFEEIIFRGFYLKSIKERSGFIWANIITSILFSLLHFSNILHHDVLQLVMLFVIGLFLGYAYEKTKSIWTPIIIHSTFNILVLLFK